MDWGAEGAAGSLGMEGPPPVWGRMSSGSGVVRWEGCEDPVEGLGLGRGWGAPGRREEQGWAFTCYLPCGLGLLQSMGL